MVLHRKRKFKGMENTLIEDKLEVLMLTCDENDKKGIWVYRVNSREVYKDIVLLKNENNVNSTIEKRCKKIYYSWNSSR